MLQSYYDILGISESATIEEIKKAYKTKALLLHPDHNSAPDAKDNFILLNEACNYLLKKRKKSLNSMISYNTEKERKSTKYYHSDREEAAKYAKMKYEEYIRSDYYKELTKISNITDLIFSFFISGIIGLFSLAFLLMIYDHLNEIPFLFIVIGSILVGGTVSLLFEKINFNDIFKLNSDLKLWQWFLLGISGSINLYVFFRFGLNVIMPTFRLLLLYFISTFLIFGIVQFLYKSTRTIKQLFYPLIYGPLPITILLYINSFSDGETYIRTYEMTENNSSFISIKDEEMSSCLGARYLSIQPSKTDTKITYILTKGKLGVPFIQSYYFLSNNRNEENAE